ncbi:MAG: ABC transporter ATP-binding protein [Candidatus Heimdallarchaeum endolithica]|uniref:ABC transporter ATP-binding protein n=1 Tax=Candidatus Heimdallarchaeum endolithica TaxID=2876572 RepID=A0A9Y1FQR0_9ARCH|nr:MAG: ABC transporter ATP-binding protein [Candidatus Heimdallarchaeum endolithica]
MFQINKKKSAKKIDYGNNILVIKNLYKQYKLGDSIVHALSNINLSIIEGEIISIVGVSGSGKTTLLNLIGALDYPDKGAIFIEGNNLATLSERELSCLRRDTLGYVFQQFNLLEELSAAKNIEMPLILAKKPKEFRKKRVKELLDLVGLEERGNHKPDQLSGGEQQRVAIARSLANDPKIILADEPTGNLDSKTGNSVINLLMSIAKKKEKTLIFVTHNIEQAKLAQRQITMHDGKIVSDEYVNKKDKTS